MNRFPSDYETARGRFVEAVRASDGSIESIPNPLLGPDGGRLYMDIALVGARDATRTLVMSSGTHGVEGFAGSGIQSALLQEGINSQLPKGVNVLMIHAINPYGMAHLRRFTEDNIDLNRNFRDHSKPHPRNLPYETLAGVISPRSLSFWSEIRAWSRIFWYRAVAGTSASQAAVSGGQYSHPDGLFYGGTFDAWSNIVIREAFQRCLSHVRYLVVVDVHTGLGKFGVAEVILNVPESSPEYKRAKAIWGGIVRTTVTGKSVSTHLEASMKLIISSTLPKAEVTPVSVEFGTVSPIGVFRAVRAENWLHHHGGPNHPKAHLFKMRILRAFNPDSEQWETSVWNQARDVVARALAYLASR